MVKKILECPKCSSRNVVRLPPSQISPHPGYQCHDCQVRLRGEGMLFVYLLMVLVVCPGMTLGVLFFLLKAHEATNRRLGGALWIGAMAIVVGGYSLMQIARPGPRRVRIADIEPPSDKP